MARYDPLVIPGYLDAQLSDTFLHLKGCSRGTFFTPRSAKLASQIDPTSNDTSDGDSRAGQVKSMSLNVGEREEEDDSGSNVSQDKRFDGLHEIISILKKVEYYSRIDNHLNGNIEENNKRCEEAALFFAPFVDGEQQMKLVRLYFLLRSRFRRDLENASERQSKEFLERAGHFLVVASILKGVHRQGINVPRSVRNNLRDQKLVDSYFSHVIGFQTGIKWEQEPSLPEWGTQSIRDLHQRWNLIPRLLIVRLWRDIRMLALYFQGNFLDGFRQVEQGGALFFFSHLAWIFFLPRLLTNIGLIYKHVFDESSMTEVELRLGWGVRLRAQLVRRWPEIFNDAAWLSIGITLLIGQTPVVSAYLAVAMQSYDLLMMIIRCILEWNRLNQLKKDLKQQCSEGSDIVLTDLNERIKWEFRELMYGICNFLVLLLCAVFMTPTFASISPILPIMAATVAVLITLVTYTMTQWFADKRRELYEGELIPPEMYCVKTINEEEFTNDPKSFENAQQIDFSVFSVGYIVILGKKSEDQDDKFRNLIYVDKRSGKLIDFNKEFNLTQEERNRIKKDIRGIISGVPTLSRSLLHILEKKEHEQLIKLVGELRNTRENISELQIAKKPTLWKKMAHQATQSVSNFSNGILGIGGG